jgi:hypothetical protein
MAVEEVLNNNDANTAQFERADTKYQLLSARIAEFDWYMLQAIERL